MPTLAWPVTSTVPVLGPDEVHVWAAELVAGEQLSRLLAVLADTERERADRFLHPTAREQFIVARGLLRALLGAYLDVAPARVSLTTAHAGKPTLCPPHASLHFNVSHSHGLALFAVTRRGPVGIDVESIRPYPGHMDLAARFFAAGEAEALSRLPPGRREEAFFHVWTRKEAFLKALGLGVSGGLEGFEVSVAPDEPARVLHIASDRQAGARWTMQVLAPAAGYVGTLCIEDTDHRLCCFGHPGP